MSARRAAWGVWGLSLVLTSAWVILDAIARRPDIGEWAFVLGGVLLYSTVGALITSRQPGNRVGLLLAWVGLSAAVSLFTGGYAVLAVLHDLPMAPLAAWISRIGFAAMFGPVGFLFLIFPTGRPFSRRWGWLMRAMLLAYAMVVLGLALTPGSLTEGFAELPLPVPNPFGLPLAWKSTVETLTVIPGLFVFVGALVSVMSLIQRFRQATTVERQQIRWLAFLGLFIGASIGLFFPLTAIGVLSDTGVLSTVMFFAFISGVFIGIPAVCGIAILKHGLWDLDVVVKKTVQYGVLVAGFTAVVGIVLLLAPAAILGVGADVGGLAPFLVGIAIAFGISLARSRARRWANRIVYGKRSTPYEVLSEFAERVGETYSVDDVLPRMAQLLGEATGARIARVWLHIDDAMRAEASWPVDAPAVPDVEVRGDELPAFAGDVAFEVRHQGTLRGALTVTEALNDPMNPTKTKLVRDMAAQAGLVLENVRLIEDLRESRRRIVAAQDVRAKKLERDIHDGAQQQLVALQVKQRLADSTIDRDPVRAHEMMAELQADTASALEELRDLARGIYPPLLADQGLAAALDSQARRSSVPVEIQPDGIGRHTPEIEAAVYFSCLEALQNVAKYANASHATVLLAQANGSLTFEVSDDGRGFDPGTAERGTGLQGIADRLAALGGELTIRSAPGDGTTIAGRIPVEGTR